MTPTLDDLIELNKKGLTVLQGVLQSLKELLPGEDPDEEADILATMGRVSMEIDRTTNVLIHLHAAETVVHPMSPATLKTLNDLADKIDQAIMTQAHLDANLDIAQSLFDTASKVRQITMMQT